MNWQKFLLSFLLPLLLLAFLIYLLNQLASCIKDKNNMKSDKEFRDIVEDWKNGRI